MQKQPGIKLQIKKGDRYHRLTVIREVKQRHQPNGAAPRRFEFKCDCGNIFETRLHSVLDGRTQSCGCLHREIMNGKELQNRLSLSRVKHGMSYHPLYRVWLSMKSRCNNKKNLKYPRYGGRGIRVCDRWNKFENFYADMGERPDGLSIDRINNNKGYNKKNCRWATIREQAKNTVNNVFLTYKGERLHLSEWARRIGIASSTITERRNKGWTIREIVSSTKWKHR